MMTFKRYSVALVAALGLVVSLSACSDDDSTPPADPGGSDPDPGPGPGPSYPKTVAIEYKVTSSTGIAKTNVTYTNETGGFANEDDVPLPYSKKLTRTVKQYDTLRLNVVVLASGELQTEIFVDDKSVKMEKWTGTSSISGAVTYIFP